MEWDDGLGSNHWLNDGSGVDDGGRGFGSVGVDLDPEAVGGGDDWSGDATDSNDELDVGVLGVSEAIDLEGSWSDDLAVGVHAVDGAGWSDGSGCQTWVVVGWELDGDSELLGDGGAGDEGEGDVLDSLSVTPVFGDDWVVAWECLGGHVGWSDEIGGGVVFGESNRVGRGTEIVTAIDGLG